MIDYVALLEQIRTRIAALARGTSFSLKELFDGISWERIPKGSRSHLGRHFKNAVLRREIANISVIGENKIHSTLYQKS